MRYIKYKRIDKNTKDYSNMFVRIPNKKNSVEEKPPRNFYSIQVLDTCPP